MQEKIGIKNFRIFDEAGVEICFSPITFLTGCNSSGKSTITKALLVLKNCLQSIRNCTVISEACIDNTKEPFCKDGSFENNLNWNGKSNLFTLSYETYSNYLFLDIKVDISLGVLTDSSLNKGQVKDITISRVDNGKTIYKINRKEQYVDLNVIEDVFYPYFVVTGVCNGAIHPVKSVNEPINQNSFEKAIDVCSPYFAFCTDEQKSKILDSCYSEEGKIAFDEYEEQCVNKYLRDNYDVISLPVLDHIDKFNKKDAIVEIQRIISEAESCYDNAKGKSVLFHAEIHTKEDYCLLLQKCLEEFTKSKYAKMSSFLRHKMSNAYSKFYIDSHEFTGWKSYYYNEWSPAYKSFYSLYQSLCVLNKAYEDQCGIYHDTTSLFKRQQILSLLIKYAVETFSDAITKRDFDGIEFLGSSRVEVKRLYSINDSDNFSRALNVLIDSQKSIKAGLLGLIMTQIKEESGQEMYTPLQFTNNWIKRFGIAESINIVYNQDFDMLSVQLEKKGKKTPSLLADEGYGITQIVSIMLMIDSHIMKYPSGDCTLIIEEPEIHLHPNFQSLISDMLIDANKYGIQFIVETHSEYIIRRSQVIVAQECKNDNDFLDNNPFQVLYVPNNGKPYDMQYQENGKFVHQFGEGFFNVSDDASMALFDLEND